MISVRFLLGFREKSLLTGQCTIIIHTIIAGFAKLLKADIYSHYSSTCKQDILTSTGGVGGGGVGLSLALRIAIRKCENHEACT